MSLVKLDLYELGWLLVKKNLEKSKGHLQQSAAANGSVQVSKASAIRNKKERAQRPEDGLR